MTKHPLSDLDADIRDHIERETQDNIERGMSPEDARYAARRKFGNATLVREDTRAVWIPVWLDQLRQDVRGTLRMMRRNLGFTAVATLSLAIGIGANTALFSVIDELLLKSLPVPDPQELVLFKWVEGHKSMRNGMDGNRTTDSATGRATSTSFSYPTFQRLRQANTTLTELFAFYPIQQLNVIFDGHADIASGQYVSGNYFSGLAIEALLGRTITVGDDDSGAPPVATITYDYWNRRFSRDPHVIGESIIVNNVPITVIGITPPGFAGTLDVTESTDVTLPFAAEPLLEPGGSSLQRPAFLWVRLMGRLKPGATREHAAGNLNGTMQQSMLDEWQQAVAKRGPSAGGDVIRTLDDASTLAADPGRQGLMDARRRYAQPLLLLMSGAVLVLLTACINVANLLLARGVARRKEFAMRVALGAQRGRLVRQLFSESMLIAVVGSVVALPLALWGTNLLLIWRPWGGGSLVLDDTLDWRVLGFCSAVAISAAILFGLAPALRVTRESVSQSTHRGAGSASAPLMKTLVVGQVAISLVLLVSAGLFVGTLRNLHAVDMGFNAENLLLFRVQPQLNSYNPPEIARLYLQMIDRIQSIPGVQMATLSRHPLLSFSRRADSVSIEGAPRSSDNGVEVNIVAANFFETMEIPLLLGRAFNRADNSVAPKVAVVNQRFAAKYFGVSNPIGHRVWFGEANNGDPIEIVGMTRDAKYTDLRSVTQPTMYVPFQQEVLGQANFEVRTGGNPLALVAAVRQAVREVDPNLPLFDVKSQIEQVQDSLAKETMFARLSALLGSIALLLAAIGLYGTMSYIVVRRSAEIGIRMALGAQRRTIMGMVLRDALVMALVGATIGIPAALVASRASRDVLDQMLFGVAANDPLTTASAASMLILVALVAGLLPARTASKVDPLVSLQCE